MHADVWVCQRVGVVRRSIACIKATSLQCRAYLPARLPAYCSLLFVRDSFLRCVPKGSLLPRLQQPQPPLQYMCATCMHTPP